MEELGYFPGATNTAKCSQGTQKHFNSEALFLNSEALSSSIYKQTMAYTQDV